jgi:hypothetical protein
MATRTYTVPVGATWTDGTPILAIEEGMTGFRLSLADGRSVWVTG